MSLENWNVHQLSIGRTSHLRHLHRYPTMQAKLVEAIMLVNQQIINLNVSNNMATPQLADTVISYGHNGPRIHYGRFSDGVHLKGSYSSKCGVKFMESLEKNRS